MSIESHSQANSHGVAATVGFAGPRHGSSRMLESYLGDIEYLMRERQWDEAAPLALALPHICGALAHPDLVSSREAYRKWCEMWVRPPQDDTSLSLPSPDELDRMAAERGVERELLDGSGVPAQSLRQLRLRRLSRAALPRRRGAPPAATEAGDGAVREACVALIDSVRRWYADWAAGSTVVQTNLARLAVLR